MLQNNKRQLFNCQNFKYLSHLGSLLVILIGVFLLPKVAYLSTITPENIINLTNEERVKNNLNKLTFNEFLTEAAYKKAEAIIENNEFAHSLNGKKFSSWIKDTGYQYSYVGENLAIDFMTSEGVVDAWLNSELHKENILNIKYQEIGLAVIEDKFQGQNSILVVQMFGAPPIIISEPRVKGINNQLYYNSPIYSLNNSEPIELENLLTNRTTNYYYNQTNLFEYQSIYNLNNQKLSNLSEVNNFFIQPNIITFIKYFNIIFSSLLLVLIIYFYFLYFAYLIKSI